MRAVPLGRGRGAEAALSSRVEAPAAVMTMARDEGAMLTRWVEYYGSQLGVENLLVFDDNSADGSTDGLPCTVHRLPKLPGGKGYENARMMLMSGIAQGLLACYPTVIFVDVDEFLIPDPARHESLPAFLAARPRRDIIAPTGLNVVHHVRVEPDLDPASPVLGQRRFAKFVPLMCKPSIKRVPARWRWASHGITAPFEVDPELFMIHLKFADRQILRVTANRRRRMVDLDGRASRSSWSTDGDELAAMLEEFVGSADPATVPEFDVRTVDLSTVVHPEGGGVFSTSGQGQVPAMKEQPLVRVPDRLLGTV